MKLAQTSKRTEHQALVYEAINKLRYFCRLYNIDSLFVVGGFCRAKYLARTWEVKDIDVASAYPSQAQLLGGLFASEIAETVPTYYHRTGTVGIDYKSDHGTITIEFQGTSAQSYMNNQDVREWLHSRNIDDVPLMQNVYGRDFTINALLYSLKSGDLIDVTGRAVADFERKKIVSLLPARLLVKNNPMVVLRAIRFSLQYDFLIHGALQDEMRGVEELLLKTYSEDLILREIVKILNVGREKGLQMLKKYDLAGLLLNRSMQKYLDTHLREPQWKDEESQPSPA